MNFFVPQPFLYFLKLFPFDYKNDKIQLKNSSITKVYIIAHKHPCNSICLIKTLTQVLSSL